MASRKHSQQELPSVDALLEEAQQSDRSFLEFRMGFAALVSSRVSDFESHKLHNLGEKEKVCWLFATYPAGTVVALCAALSSIDGGSQNFKEARY